MFKPAQEPSRDKASETADRPRPAEVLARYARTRLDRLTKKSFLEAYRLSTRHYWQQHAAGASWCRLGGLVEYDTRLISMLSADSDPFPLIAIRAAPGRRFARVKLTVVAKHAGVVHRDTAVVPDLADSPVLVGVPAIPWVSAPCGEGQTADPRGSLYIKLTEAVDADGCPVEGIAGMSDIFRPRVMGASPDEFTGRWGLFWNTALIDQEKRRLMDRCYLRLVKSAGHLWRPLRWRRAAYGLLTKGPLVSLAFWSHNLVDAKRLRASMDLPAGADGSLPRENDKKAA
jgi:hypothetical protein